MKIKTISIIFVFLVLCIGSTFCNQSEKYPQIDRFKEVYETIMCYISAGHDPDDILLVLDLDETVFKLYARKHGTYIHSGHLFGYIKEETEKDEQNKLEVKQKWEPVFLPEVLPRIAENYLKRFALYNAAHCIGFLQEKNVLQADPIERTLTSDYIKRLQDLGVKVIGLTSREIGTKKITIERLSSMEIDFTKTAPIKEDISFGQENDEYRAGVHEYYKGILFLTPRAEGGMDKGKLLNCFLTKVEEDFDLPSRIVFVDDSRENLKVVEHALEKKYPGILVEGLEYTRVNDLPFNKKIVNYLLEKYFGEDWCRPGIDNVPCKLSFKAVFVEPVAG